MLPRGVFSGGDLGPPVWVGVIFTITDEASGAFGLDLFHSASCISHVYLLAEPSLLHSILLPIGYSLNAAIGGLLANSPNTRPL